MRLARVAAQRQRGVGEDRHSLSLPCQENEMVRSNKDDSRTGLSQRRVITTRSRSQGAQNQHGDKLIRKLCLKVTTWHEIEDVQKQYSHMQS